MNFKSYAQIIEEMMSEYKITRKMALEWDTFGVRNLEKYFDSWKVPPVTRVYYMNLLKGRESA
jgi:hypothetical protein